MKPTLLFFHITTGLFCSRRFVIALWIVRRRHVFLYRVLSVVIVVTQRFCAFIRRYRTIAIAFRVIGVSHLDLRPNMQPRRIEIAVYRGLEIIDREIVVSLFEEQQTEMVIDPGVGTIEL